MWCDDAMCVCVGGVGVSGGSKDGSWRLVGENNNSADRFSIQHGAISLLH